MPFDLPEPLFFAIRNTRLRF